MRLVKFLKLIVGSTFIALIYIYMQMEIFTLAYYGKVKQKQIKKIKEENLYLSYATLSLKSASHLGGKLLAENSQMQFVDPQNVVEVAMRPAKRTKKSLTKNKKVQKQNYLLSLIALKSQAEAKQ